MTERDALYAKASELGVPFIDLDHYKLDLELLKIIPKSQAINHRILPLKKEGSTLWLAMVNINNLQAIDDVRMGTKCRVVPVMAIPALIDQYVKAHYQEASSQTQTVQTVKPSQEVARMRTTTVEITGDDQSSIVKLADTLLHQAIADRASDIHIEPQTDQVRVRYRVDGVLVDAQSVPKNMHAALVSRLKIMAEMDIAERRLPQDGRIQTNYQGKDFDLRTSTIPTAFGEKMVLRILDKSSVMIGLEQLNFTEENRKKILDISAHSNGMFLCTGPTGSGKTTTLYSVLQILNKTASNILTVEDPVEYQVQGISQVQVNRKAGLTFASALKAFLRQDPDIIMVGEMRDLETSQIAVESALTGHLVLSTLHTNDAPSTILRLIDMGVEPYLISATVIGVLAQRLGRKLCPDCKQAHQTPASELQRIGYVPKNDHEMVTVYKGVGCPNCKNTGYRGRIGIHELMVLNEQIAELIATRASVIEIRDAAKASGMKELREDGLEKVLLGLTDLDEVLRVVYTAGY